MVFHLVEWGVEALVEDSEGSLGDGNSFLVFVRKALSWPTNSLFLSPAKRREEVRRKFHQCWHLAALKNLKA